MIQLKSLPPVFAEQQEHLLICMVFMCTDALWAKLILDVNRCNLSDLNSIYALKPAVSTSVCLYHMSCSHFCSWKWVKCHWNLLHSNSSWFPRKRRLDNLLSFKCRVFFFLCSFMRHQNGRINLLKSCNTRNWLFQLIIELQSLDLIKLFCWFRGKKYLRKDLRAISSAFI